MRSADSVPAGHAAKLRRERMRRRHADAETSTIPVIAVTASAMPEDRKKILEAGFDGMQTKPIHVVEFLRTVEKALSPKRG